MRPTSIVLFERLFLLSLAIALVNGFLQYDALVAQVGNDPALAQLGWGSGAILVVMAISLLIPLLLWYFIARRASNIAKWILVVMTLLGLLFVNLDPGQLGSLGQVGCAETTRRHCGYAPARNGCSAGKYPRTLSVQGPERIVPFRFFR